MMWHSGGMFNVGLASGDFHDVCTLGCRTCQMWPNCSY